MQALQIFNFQSSSIRTVLANDGEIWFVAKDVALALGYTDTKQAISLHCKQSKSLRDISGGKVTTTTTLQPASILIPESDVYRLTMKSTLPTAEPFQDWLAEEVIPSIRKTGSYSVNTQNKALPTFKEAIEGVAVLADYLRLSDSSRIAFVKPVIEQYGVNVALPSYAVDSSILVTNGSSMPTKSVSELLKQHGVKMSAMTFNKRLESLGFIETLTRKSSKGEKSYKSVTSKGLAYGKNVVSPNNTKETQPHWYIDLFSELLNIVMKQ